MINKMNKKLIILVLGIFLISFAYAADGETGVSFCCEKTTDGAWCQNADESKCDGGYRAVPTSCEATSYCSLGCCYDSQEGTCMENTPEVICNNNGGIFSPDSAQCDIPQCTLGCCLMGDQAAFVTQTRCKRLSALYGLEIDFRTEIQNELTCIASARPDIEGACVFEEDFERTCKRTKKSECQEMGADSENSTIKFYEEKLCSDDKLGTNCGPTTRTTCVEDDDAVYFLDSCGNLANVYDAEKINDKNYWADIYSKAESCNPLNSNADSPTCGNCDYYLGSTCRTYQRGVDEVRPEIGDNICRDLGCEYEGQTYEHGETWCAQASGTSVIVEGVEVNPTPQSILSENLPGSRYFRLVCYDGEVTVEPCADFRQEYCLQTEVNGFSSAACVANKWQDCTSQTDPEECENRDQRDCKWVEAYDKQGCIPLYAPGFDFWNPESEANSICNLLTGTCKVIFEEKILEDEECVDNCECLEDDAEEKANYACSSLGDCGVKQNYLGVEGFNKFGDDFNEKTDIPEKAGSIDEEENKEEEEEDEE